MFPFNAEDQIDINLYKGKVHLLSGELDYDNVDVCIKWILSENIVSDISCTPLKLYINSTGGDLYNAFALIDVMRSSKRLIYTYGIGAVMSAAFLVFASGSQRHRYAYKNCSFMMHQYSGTVEGKHHDLKASVKEMDHSNSKMISILKDATSMSLNKIKSTFLPPSDVFFNAEELVVLGIADSVV